MIPHGKKIVSALFAVSQKEIFCAHFRVGKLQSVGLLHRENGWMLHSFKGDAFFLEIRIKLLLVHGQHILCMIKRERKGMRRSGESP
jgi:hypothetical protein